MFGFIVNPLSGNGRGRAVWSLLQDYLDKEHVPYEVRFTRASGDGKALAGSMARSGKVKAIVAVGGDGTVHEVAAGVIAAESGCSLGYIAAGSGNDFARGHRLPLQPLEALKQILGNREARAIDFFRMGESIAVSSVGIGLDGLVAKMTNESGYKKWLNLLRLGKLSYVLTLIRVLLIYRPCDAVVSVDGIETPFRNVWLIAAANIPYYGGGMMICPDALPADGFAEVCVVSEVSRWRLLRLFPLVFSGRHASLPEVRFLRGRRIAVRSETPLFVHTDGEAHGPTPVAIEVVPSGLQVIRPPL